MVPIVAFALAVVAITPATAFAKPIDFFTWSFTDNFYFFSAADFQTDGSASATSQVGSNSQAFAEGSAAADLSAGTLRALAHTRSNAGYVGGGDTETFAGFGDSFRTLTSTGAPFDWTGKTATMKVDISGLISSSGASPYSNGSVAMCVLPAGGLDALGTRIKNNNYIEDSDFEPCLSVQGYNLGPGDGDLPELLTFPTSVEFTFAPGGDFDWFMAIYLQVSSEFGGESIGDFSHTAQATYVGPAGGVTQSASGVFPGTSPLADPLTPVPEPATICLLGAGLVVAANRRRVKRQ